MKSDTLINFLQRRISAQDLSEEISGEVEIYKQSLNKIGSSASVYLYGEKNITVGYSQLLTILNSFLEGSLDKFTFMYICDVLDLSESANFKCGWIQGIISSISNSDIDSTFNENSVREIRDEVSLRMRKKGS